MLLRLKVVSLGLLTAGFLPFGPSAFGAYTLDECYQAALAKSEDLASQGELLVQAEEKARQALGAIFPSVTASLTNVSQPAPPTAANIFPAQQTTLKFTASQPLFRGFREFGLLKQQKDLKESTQLNRNHAAILLFQDVTVNYYVLLGARADIHNYQHELALNKKRRDELKSFHRIGRSREVEVLTLDANIATLEALIATAEATERTARGAFEFLTGLDSASGLSDVESIPKDAETQSLESYLKHIPDRPDIQALEKAAAASDVGIRIARGGHLPSADLTFDYYLMRPGVLADSNYALTLGVTMPLFQGGIIQSQVRAAASVSKQSELALARGQRAAKQQIEDSYYQFMSGLKRLGKLREAVELQARNYDADQRDYKHGLVTNLEVLQVLTAFQESQRVLDRSELQIKSDFLKLLAAAAIRPSSSATSLEKSSATH